MVTKLLIIYTYMKFVLEMTTKKNLKNSNYIIKEITNLYIKF